MFIDFNTSRIVSTEFGIGRHRPTSFYLVPVDSSVQKALREMVERTIDSMNSAMPRDDAHYQPSEKYGSREYCYVSLSDPVAKHFRDVVAADLGYTSRFPSDLRNLTCYLVQLVDDEGRKLTAFRRASYFKGVCKKKLVSLVDDTLRLVPDTVFKLDDDFDFLIDSTAIHVWRPRSLEALGDLKTAVLQAVPANIAELSREMPNVDFAPVGAYSEKRIRAARQLASIRQYDLQNVDMNALAEQCDRTGVEVRWVNGRLSMDEKNVTGFLEVLDRRRYRVELVKEAPESYRASSRRKVGG